MSEYGGKHGLHGAHRDLNLVQMRSVSKRIGCVTALVITRRQNSVPDVMLYVHPNIWQTTGEVNRRLIIVNRQLMLFAPDVFRSH